MLSVPAFRWFYFQDPDTRVRLSGSTCQVIGPHFIRFGGWSYYGPTQALGPTCINPISIFNLNSFTWTDAFDPSTTYQPPTKVKAWNTKNANPVSGWSTGVQALFVGMNSTTTHTPPTNSPSPTGKPTPSILPAALGGILGGLLVIGLLLGGILFLIKRKKKRMQMQSVSDRFELAGEARERPVAEMAVSQQPVAELSAIPDLLVGPPIDLKKGGSEGPRSTEVP